MLIAAAACGIAAAFSGIAMPGIKSSAADTPRRQFTSSGPGLKIGGGTYYPGTHNDTQGNPAYCLEEGKMGPGEGDGSTNGTHFEWYSLNSNWGTRETALNYVAYNGYPLGYNRNGGTIGGNAMTKDEAIMATCLAVWMVTGDVNQAGDYYSHTAGATRNWITIGSTASGRARMKALVDIAWNLRTAGFDANQTKDVPRVVSIWNPDNSKFQQLLLTVAMGGSAKVRKVSANPAATDGNANYSLEGAVFGIYSNANDATNNTNSLGNLTTGPDGTTPTLDNLTPGDYWAREITAPKGFTLNETPVMFTVQAGGTAEVSVTDMPIEKKLRIQKIDKQTGNPVKAAGFTFRLLASDGTTPYQTSEGKSDYTTGTDGIANVPALPLGTYNVQEIDAPDPYIVNKTPVKVDVQVDSPDPIGISITDDRAYGKLTVQKTENVTGGPVGGAVFDITATKTITLPDGTIEYKQGELVERITTDKSTGTATSTKPLWLGSDGKGPYTLTEVSVPKGWAIDPEKKVTQIEFDRANVDKEQQVILQTQPIKNIVPTFKVHIDKMDSEDNARLDGAAFEIYADEDITLANGRKAYTQDQLIDTVTTKADGSIENSKPLYIGADGDGKYRAIEIDAPEGHVIDKTPHHFVGTYEGQDVLVTKTQTLNIKNKANMLLLSKNVLSKDGKTFDDETVEGARFWLWREADELTVTPEKGYDAYALRIGGYDGKTEDDHTVTLYQQLDDAQAKLDATSAKGYTITLRNATGDMIQLDGSKGIALEPGDYDVVVKDANGNQVDDYTGDRKLTAKAGDEYAFTVKEGGITGKALVSVDSTEIADRSVSTTKQNGAYIATKVKPNAVYSVKVDGKEVYQLRTDGEAATGTNTDGNATSNTKDKTDTDDGNSDGNSDSGSSKDTTSGKDDTDGNGKDDADKDDPHEEGGHVYYGRLIPNATDYAYRRQPMLLTSDDKHITKFTINGKDYPVTELTDKSGAISIKRITTGEYAFGEVDVPFVGQAQDNGKDTKPGTDRSYLVNTNILRFTVDGTTGRLNDKEVLGTTFTDDWTQTDVSKNEITGGPEIPGAHLEIRDHNNNVIEQWTSTDTPHRVDRLTPGKYTLVEVMTPNNYDQATRVEFTVYDTGKVQKVEMHDKPLHIDAKIDKRQEIADPLGDAAEANGDGKNKADVTQSNDGKYLYSLDYKNDSNTWVDEFTVYDPLDGVNAGYVRLNGLTTGQGYEDYDGKLNVWYQTNKTPSDYADDQYKANATKDDGHDNPWLTNPNDDIKSRDTDGDGRILSYVGWKLWKKDVDATQAMTLSVSDLGLSDGEYVTGVRLEYGRVEEGFTTRPDGWDRAELKDAHDDMKPVEQFHAGTFKVKGLTSVLSNLGTLETYLTDYLNALYPDNADPAGSDASANANGNSNANVADDGAKSAKEAAERQFALIRERIREAVDANDEQAIHDAVDDAKALVDETVQKAFAAGVVKDSRSLDRAVETFGQVYGRVRALLPSDTVASVDKVISDAKAVVDNGDPEKIEDARQALLRASGDVLDSLSTSVVSASDIHYAATIMDMQLTDKYVPGVNLDNSAYVDAYRNGGGEGLEGHDEDKVTQTPKAADLANDLLAQTGDDSRGAILTITIVTSAVLVGMALRRRMAA